MTPDWKLRDEIDKLIIDNMHKSQDEKLLIFGKFMLEKLKDPTEWPGFLRGLADYIEEKPLTTKALAGLLELMDKP